MKVRCTMCGEMIEQGIANMITHHFKKHNLKYDAQKLVDLRFKKGSPLTSDDLLKLRLTEFHQNRN